MKPPGGGDRIELYRDKTGQHRWRRVSQNGNIIATSGEAYVRKIDAVKIARKLYPGLYLFEIDVETKDPG